MHRRPTIDSNYLYILYEFTSHSRGFVFFYFLPRSIKNAVILCKQSTHPALYGFGSALFAKNCKSLHFRLR